MVIGVLSFVGGVMMVSMLPSPTWYNALDLILAYIPMAYFGFKLAGGSRNTVKESSQTLD